MVDTVATSQVPDLVSVSSRVRLTDLSGRARVIVRGVGGSKLAIQLGSIVEGRSVLRGEVRIARLAIDTWLYVGETVATAQAVADLDLSGPTAVIDMTHGWGAIRVTGPGARELLSWCSRCNLSDEEVPDGAVVSADVAGVACHVLRNDLDGPASYLLMFGRSYAEHLAAELVDLTAVVAHSDSGV